MFLMSKERAKTEGKLFQHHFTCTFDPVVMLISTAKSFSLPSIFSDLLDFSTNNEPPRFLIVGDPINDGDDRQCFEGDDAVVVFDGVVPFVTLTLFSVNGTFDILLMPSFLLRFCALSKNLCWVSKRKKCRKTCEREWQISRIISKNLE